VRATALAVASLWLLWSDAWHRRTGCPPSYPHALFFLELVQSPAFRGAIGQAAVKVRLARQAAGKRNAEAQSVYLYTRPRLAGDGTLAAVLLLAALPHKQTEEVTPRARRARGRAEAAPTAAAASETSRPRR